MIINIHDTIISRRDSLEITSETLELLMHVQELKLDYSSFPEIFIKSGVLNLAKPYSRNKLFEILAGTTINITGASNLNFLKLPHVAQLNYYSRGKLLLKVDKLGNMYTKVMNTQLELSDVVGLYEHSANYEDGLFVTMAKVNTNGKVTKQLCQLSLANWRLLLKDSGHVFELDEVMC